MYDLCAPHRDKKACNEQGGCFWFAHITGLPQCSCDSGVDCGTHRAPTCPVCRSYDGEYYKGKDYCSGECEWTDDWGGYCK